MTRKLFSCFCFLLLFGEPPAYAQEQKEFNPTLWLYNPTTKKTSEEFPKLNFKSRLTPGKTSLGTSARKLQPTGHLFVVYQAEKNENLINLISDRRAVFLDSKVLKINDSVDLSGYNESYGELLDIQYGGMDSGKFWMNTQTESSGIYEVVLIDSKTSTRTVNEIRTYLAIKYGINLVDYKQYVYKREKLWDGSKNKYNHRIFGLAQLSLFGLKPSKSMHSKDQDLIVSVSKRQRSQFRDGTYLLFGTNNNPLVFDHKTGESKKEWLVQTNKEQLKVNLSFKLNSLNSADEVFKSYELVVLDGSKALRNYTGTLQDSLLVFRNVSFSNQGNSILKLKESPSEIKLDIDKDCEYLRLKVKGASNLGGYEISIIDDKGLYRLTETLSQKTYTISKDSSTYYDIHLKHDNKRTFKRIITSLGMMKAYDLESYYSLVNQEVTLHLENPNNFSYEWYKGDLYIDKGNSITLKEEGFYNLLITNESGCTISQSFNVGSNSPNDFWRVFPNPAKTTDHLQVAFELEDKSLVNLALYQMDGQLIRKYSIGSISRETVNLGTLNLSSGVYILVAYINNIPQIKKIIIN